VTLLGRCCLIHCNPRATALPNPKTPPKLPKNACHPAVPTLNLFRHRNTPAPLTRQEAAGHSSDFGKWDIFQMSSQCPSASIRKRRVFRAQLEVVGCETPKGSGRSFGTSGKLLVARPQRGAESHSRTYAKCLILRSPKNDSPRPSER